MIYLPLRSAETRLLRKNIFTYESYDLRSFLSVHDFSTRLGIGLAKKATQKGIL